MWHEGIRLWNCVKTQQCKINGFNMEDTSRGLRSVVLQPRATDLGSISTLIQEAYGLQRVPYSSSAHHLVTGFRPVAHSPLPKGYRDF